jgi:hypothetical protein
MAHDYAWTSLAALAVGALALGAIALLSQIATVLG